MSVFNSKGGSAVQLSWKRMISPVHESGSHSSRTPSQRSDGVGSAFSTNVRSTCIFESDATVSALGGYKYRQTHAIMKRNVLASKVSEEKAVLYLFRSCNFRKHIILR